MKVLIGLDRTGFEIKDPKFGKLRGFQYFLLSSSPLIFQYIALPLLLVLLPLSPPPLPPVSCMNGSWRHHPFGMKKKTLFFTTWGLEKKTFFLSSRNLGLSHDLGQTSGKKTFQICEETVLIASPICCHFFSLSLSLSLSCLFVFT